MHAEQIQSHVVRAPVQHESGVAELEAQLFAEKLKVRELKLLRARSLAQVQQSKRRHKAARQVIALCLEQHLACTVYLGAACVIAHIAP